MAVELSIISTAKNAELTIGQMIGSVQAQRFQDWELVVVDDESADGTQDAVRTLVAQDERIRLYPTTGLGRAKALNRAIEEARSDLIMNVDADDLLHPQCVAFMVNAARRLDDFAAVTARARLFGDGERLEWEAYDTPTTPVAIEDVTGRLLRSNPVCHSAVVMKKARVNEVGGYDSRLRSQFDYDLWIRLASNGYKIGRLQATLAGKRVHANQSFETQRRLRYLLNSSRTQARAIRQLNGQAHHWALLVARFFWGLRPRVFIQNLKTRARHP